MENLNPVDVLKARLKTCSQAELAEEMDVSPGFICNVLALRRKPSPRMLEVLGIEKCVTYRMVNGRRR